MKEATWEKTRVKTNRFLVFPLIGWSNERDILWPIIRQCARTFLKIQNLFLIFISFWEMQAKVRASFQFNLYSFDILATQNAFSPVSMTKQMKDVIPWRLPCPPFGCANESEDVPKAIQSERRAGLSHLRERERERPRKRFQIFANLSLRKTFIPVLFYFFFYEESRAHR